MVSHVCTCARRASATLSRGATCRTLMYATALVALGGVAVVGVGVRVWGAMELAPFSALLDFQLPLQSQLVRQRSLELASFPFAWLTGVMTYPWPPRTPVLSCNKMARSFNTGCAGAGIRLSMPLLYCSVFRNGAARVVFSWISDCCLSQASAPY